MTDAHSASTEQAALHWSEFTVVDRLLRVPASVATQGHPANLVRRRGAEEPRKSTDVLRRHESLGGLLPAHHRDRSLVKGDPLLIRAALNLNACEGRQYPSRADRVAGDGALSSLQR